MWLLLLLLMLLMLLLWRLSRMVSANIKPTPMPIPKIAVAALANAVTILVTSKIVWHNTISLLRNGILGGIPDINEHQNGDEEGAEKEMEPVCTVKEEREGRLARVVERDSKLQWAS